jgi:two-component system LytT family sensor kinase
MINPMNKSRRTGRRLTIALHALAWMIILLIPLYIFNKEVHPRVFQLPRFYLQTLIFIILFYLNFFWLVPRMWLKGRKLRFVLASAGLILFFLAVLVPVEKYGYQAQRPFVPEPANNLSYEKRPVPPPGFHWSFFLYNYLFTSILISGFCVGLRVTEQLSENEDRTKELEKEKLNSELAMLKNQISPHFFFNTLNNIYSLIAINTEDAQDSVLKLSKLMRYLLYESEQSHILLSREIEFMTHYIDLMKLRLSEKVRLDVNFPVEYKDVNIPPLLFIPFMENAFKHGISYRESSFINISLAAGENAIEFRCVNRIGAKGIGQQENGYGIGLENVVRRLNLLFPGRHELKILEENQEYSVNLNIQLNDKLA